MTTTSARTTRSVVRRTSRVIAIMLVAFAGVFAQTAPASAATWPGASGQYGGVSLRGVQGTSQYYKVPTALYGSTVPAINVTGPLVGRSNASSGNQIIEYRFVIWRDTGSSWGRTFTRAGRRRPPLAPVSTADFGPISLPLTYGPRSYYRVTGSVTWKNQYGQALGGIGFDDAHQSDYIGLVSGCQTGPGWILQRQCDQLTAWRDPMPARRRASPRRTLPSMPGS